MGNDVNDDAPIEALAEAVKHMHGCDAVYVETVPITETFHGATIWTGDVKVFDLVGHAGGAPRAYAWSYRTTGTKRQFVAVIHAGPVTGPREAVQATIMAEAKVRRS